jgi:hypothetical protein
MRRVRELAGECDSAWHWPSSVRFPISWRAANEQGSPSNSGLNPMGAVQTAKGRDAWALLELEREAGKRGCTPITTPGPRWSAYVFNLRGMGLIIETIHESHDGPFPGTHARYVLHSPDLRSGGSVVSKREFSKISPALWRSGRFLSLDSDAKVLHIYFLTSEHQNSAGCFRLPDGYACSDLGWQLGCYIRCRNQVIKVGLVSFDNETSEVFVHRWFKHNPPMNDKHALGTCNIINRVESDDIREKVEAEFQEVDERRKGKGAQTDAPFGDTSRLTQTGIIRRGGGQR